MVTSFIDVSSMKPKTYGALTRKQHYVEKSQDGQGETPAAWRDARDELRRTLTLTPENFTKWIAPVQARTEGDEGEQLILASPDEFGRVWLERRLGHRIQDALTRTGHGDLQLTYEVAPPRRPTEASAPRIIESRDDWAAYTQQLLADYGVTPRQGKTSERYNSPLAIHYTMSASPQWFKDQPAQTERWIEASAAFIRQLHGADRVLGIVVHDHQSTPHIHAVAIPIDARGHLSASAFTRTRAQLEALHTQYNRSLRAYGLDLERGRNARLDRQLAADPALRQRAQDADAIPLAEVLDRLEATRDSRVSDRWTVGDRIIVTHADGHGFTEIGPAGAIDGHGALDLVTRLRQEGETPLEQHTLAVDYLAVTHPERIAGGAPPLVPSAPAVAAAPTLDPVTEATGHRMADTIAFGRATRWEPGQFILVDSLPEAAGVARTAAGWGKVAGVTHPDRLPVDELDEAVAKGWMVDVASRSDRLYQAVTERYPDLAERGGRQIWRSGAPALPRLRKVEKEHMRDDGHENGRENAGRDDGGREAALMMGL